MRIKRKRPRNGVRVKAQECLEPQVHMYPLGAPGDALPVNAAQRSRKNGLHVIRRRAPSDSFLPGIAEI